jgi:hypothetical protein
MNKEIAKDDLRPGLRLSAGIVTLIEKIGIIADGIDAEYRRLYNACVLCHKGVNGLEAKINKYRKYRDKENTQDYTKKTTAIIDSIWNNPNTELQEADIFVAGEFDADNVANVSPFYLSQYCLNHPLTVANKTEDQKKQKALKFRKRIRESITSTANDLRKAVVELAAFIDKSYTRLEMTKKIGNIQTTNMPKNYKDAMTAAFSKDKLGDTFYHKEKAGGRSTFAATLGNNGLADELKALKHKAAMVLLEELGFKDEWRTKKLVVPNPSYDPNHPQAFPQNIEVNTEKKFDENSLKDLLKWSYYVQSITSVPKLSPIDSKLAMAAEALLDTAKSAIDWEDMKFFAHPRDDNWSWGEAKQGGILFNYKGHTYNLKNDISQIEGASKENLTTADDGAALNGPVNQFLTSIKDALIALTDPQP